MAGHPWSNQVWTIPEFSDLRPWSALYGLGHRGYNPPAENLPVFGQRLRNCRYFVYLESTNYEIEGCSKNIFNTSGKQNAKSGNRKWPHWCNTSFIEILVWLVVSTLSTVFLHPFYYGWSKTNDLSFLRRSKPLTSFLNTDLSQSFNDIDMHWSYWHILCRLVTSCLAHWYMLLFFNASCRCLQFGWFGIHEIGCIYIYIYT